MTLMRDKHTIVMKHRDGEVEKIQTEGFHMALYLCRLLMYRRTHVKICIIKIYNLNGDLVCTPYNYNKNGISVR